MNTTAVAAEQQPWSQAPENVHTMAQITGDLADLSNIFNIGDFDLDGIPSVDPAQYHAQLPHSHPGTHPGTPFGDAMSQPPPGTTAQDYGGHDGFGLVQAVDGQFEPQDNDLAATTLPYAAETMYQPSLPQSFHVAPSPQFALGTQQHFHPGQHVPPTPNSFEMHGEAGRFMQQQLNHQQQRAILEQQNHMRKNDQQSRQAQFTPMASPNGTPQFTMPPEFTAPGAYFSPLTSPALHAQLPSHPHHFHQQQGYYTNPNTAPNSNAASPIDANPDVEMANGVALPEPANEQAKKGRRKMATPRSVGPTASKPRQTPTSKPQKRKSGMLSSVVPPRDLNSAPVNGLRSGTSQPGSAGLRMPSMFDSSESGSISPEPLSEALMGPPPRPGSLTQSPALTAQQQQQQQQAQQQDSAAATAGRAATPKSILSRRANQSVNGTPTTATSQLIAQSSLEDLQLPEAASDHASRRTSLTNIESTLSRSSSKDTSSHVSARKTPKLGPLSTPSSVRPPSACASPATAFSPIIASTPAGLLKDKKQDGKGPRSNKKRGSTGTSTSTMLSPALRPRISPSIKPLLPEGSTLHSPSHALLLASKSNYQNLLEGNHLPGVSYPDSLSSGLTSKRTSHKVAEQGRRNRINDALKEMQELIPSPAIPARSGSDDVDGLANDEEGSPDGIVATTTTAAAGANADAESREDSKESAAAKNSSSKAATVESANQYIRKLKEDDASQKAAIVALRQENDEIRRRLAEATGVLLASPSEAIGEADGEASGSSGRSESGGV